MKLYLIKRRGMWYRPNALGYTSDIVNAGLFDLSEAKSHFKTEGVSVHPLSKMRSVMLGERASLMAKINELDQMLNHLPQEEYE